MKDVDAAGFLHTLFWLRREAVSNEKALMQNSLIHSDGETIERIDELVENYDDIQQTIQSIFDDWDHQIERLREEFPWLFVTYEVPASKQTDDANLDLTELETLRLYLDNIIRRERMLWTTRVKGYYEIPEDERPLDLRIHTEQEAAKTIDSLMGVLMLVIDMRERKKKASSGKVVIYNRPDADRGGVEERPGRVVGTSQ